jgi:hypothetical protein
MEKRKKPLQNQLKKCLGFDDPLCKFCKRKAKTVGEATETLVDKLITVGAGRKTCIHYIKKGH